MFVTDAVTGQDGTFHLTAWGPKKIPKGLEIRGANEPQGHKGPAVCTSDYDGKTIEPLNFEETTIARKYTGRIFLRFKAGSSR
jgi:hypothetical protein